MNKFFKTAFVVLALSGAACTQAGATGETDRAKIEAIVKDYLLENPEIIRDALIALNEKEEREAMQAVKHDMLNDKRDPVIGPKKAKVTIVEFFDYNCSFCKKSTDWLQETIDANPKNVRVIFKELPLLDGRTKTSRNAAKAALAADRQDKYAEMHFALMAERGLSTERINAIAEKIGLNMDLFEQDFNDPALAAHIEDNIDLARRIPMFNGTPFFMINDQHISGADTDSLTAMLKDELGS